MATIYIIAGLLHFIRPKMYMRILPSYLPGHKLLVALSGILEILLGIGLCFAETKNFAIYLLIAMLLFFLPVHFHMLFDKKSAMGLPKWALICRIPLQFGLMFWAYWYLKY